MLERRVGVDEILGHLVDQRLLDLALQRRQLVPQAAGQRSGLRAGALEMGKTVTKMTQCQKFKAMIIIRYLKIQGNAKIVHDSIKSIAVLVCCKLSITGFWFASKFPAIASQYFGIQQR